MLEEIIIGVFSIIATWFFATALLSGAWIGVICTGIVMLTLYAVLAVILYERLEGFNGR